LHNEWSFATPAKTLTLNTKIMRTPLVNCPLYCLAAIAVGFAGIVSAPPAVAQGIQASGGEPALILAGEFKTTENVQPTEEEAKKAWSVYENVGYASEYNFRGTNLTPDSDGAIFATANISFHGLTLGIYGIHQVGTAKADAFSISEGGGGGVAANITLLQDDTDLLIPPFMNDATFKGRISPQTIQKAFDEIDLYLTYLYQLGPIDITVGDIAFFINRGADTRVTTRGTLTDPDEAATVAINQTAVIPTVGDEQFDRLFVEIAAPRLIPYVVPKIRYYQTILNEGDDPVEGRLLTLAQTDIPLPSAGILHTLTVNGAKERNDALGGYLEGRVDAVLPVTDRIRVKPYGIISYSFHDRSEPFSTTQPQPISHIFHGRTLVGFNHAQFGVTVPIELWRSSPNFVLTFEPFGAYSYHISEPTAGTDRDEVWGGAQFVLTF